MKLSIITINYNNKAGLEKTIESVLSQTCHDFEWIIIDGGSSDGSKEVIAELAKNPEANIAYWCSEKDNGVYNAMNKGIAKASGEYLNFMNSGDCFYEPETLEKVFSKGHIADIIYGDWKRIKKDKTETMRFPYPIEIYNFFKGNISHQAMFIKRNYHIKHLYDESYKFFADYKNWASAAINNASFEHCPFVVCTVTMDGISTIRNSQTKEEYKKLKNEVWKRPVLITLENYDKQLNDPYQLRLRNLIAKGGVPRFITLCFLKIMKILFLKDLDETWSQGIRPIESYSVK